MRALRVAARAAVLLALAACGGTENKAGSVSYTLAGPAPARAVTFRLVGKQTGITASSTGYHVYPSAPIGDTLVVTVVANQGSTLTGAVVDFALPDRNVRPTLTILQVADNSYVLKNASLYALTALAPAP